MLKFKNILLTTFVIGMALLVILLFLFTWWQIINLILS